jgi:hypothetical protein
MAASSPPAPPTVRPPRPRLSGHEVREYAQLALTGVVPLLLTVGIILVLLPGIRPPITSTHPPYILGMTNGGSSEPAPGVFAVDLALDPTAGLSTSMFALDLYNDTSGSVLPGSAPPSCAAPAGASYTSFTPTHCGAPAAGWYAVLTFTNDSVASVFDHSGTWSGAPVLLNATMQIFLVSGTNLTGTGALNTYGTGSTSVAGSIPI